MFIKVIGFIVFYKYYSLTLVLHFFLLGCIFDLIRFKQAYSESIYPVGDKAYWDIPSDVAKFVCRPPSTRFPSGRRKKKRIPSSWEYGKYRSKSQSTPKGYKCSRCGQQGHNKSTCVEPIG